MKIDQHVYSGFHIHFDNGFTLSTIWGAGSYSDNHDLIMDQSLDIFERFRKIPLQTETVECMLFADVETEKMSKFIKKIYKKFNSDGSVIPYMPVADWLKLISLINKYKP